MQPVQLSLLPDQVPARPVMLIAQLPNPRGGSRGGHGAGLPDRPGSGPGRDNAAGGVSAGE